MSYKYNICVHYWFIRDGQIREEDSDVIGTIICTASAVLMTAQKEAKKLVRKLEKHSRVHDFFVSYSMVTPEAMTMLDASGFRRVANLAYKINGGIVVGHIYIEEE